MAVRACPTCGHVPPSERVPKGLAPAMRLLSHLRAVPDDPTACWETDLSLGGDKRDRPQLWSREHRRSLAAARFVLEAKLGRPLAAGELALHTCDNPACVRPEHLFVGTHADNQADKCRKGRQARGIRNGRAKLSGEQVAEVRALADGGWLQQDIANAYGVSQPTVGRIFRRRVRVHG